MISCPKCQQKADFHHVHDAPHGLCGAHMDGSERYICQSCNHAIYKAEGEALGLNFVLD